MSIMPKGARPVTVFTANVLTSMLACLFAGLAPGLAQAQEDAASAAQRPVIHAPPVTPPPPRPAVDTLPKWSEFPTPPTDVPTVAEIAQRVRSQTMASGNAPTRAAKAERALTKAA